MATADDAAASGPRPQSYYDDIKSRFAEARDLRLKYRPEGTAQYTSDLTGDLARYEIDPYADDGAERAPIHDEVEVLFIGGGFSALLTAARLRELPDGSTVRTAGLVITRQRPGSAMGVTFVTLEDETGHVNLIVWRDVAERQRQALIASRLMGVAGKLQLEGEVLHVIVHRIVDLSRWLGRVAAPSRDFH